ncbi:aldehyde dehydrogenase family 16 member A1 [Megalops cyprinoides]|uniref:aldehyde dehydrogenase family 16 member A1 n=1 Tax=Megalops cyprinoides TaxID=118141 RepID=UPI001864DB0D|nr:aldehyde dehydrogenase family 16 member A1 [Megalops cyprinoides]
MAGSTTKSVHDIFESMEYGPASSNTSTAQSWLESHSHALGLFINGAFVCPSDRQACNVTDASGQRLCSTVCAADEDVSLSASSSLTGFKAWSELSCYQRAKVFQSFGSGLQRHSQCLAELCEMVQSPSSVSALVRLVQYYSGWAQLRDVHVSGWTPQGVVAVAVSDDCSLYSLLLKVLPALAVGNAVIVIPGCGTALPALLIGSLFHEAGLPAGTLNVVTGKDLSLGIKVAQNPKINCFTYCGNKKEGEMLSRETAGWGVPVSLSLSANAVCPFIIFESADIDSAVDGVIETAFKKKKEWQWVLCVQESVWESVVARLKVRMAGMKCLPLLAESDRHIVEAAVQEAQQQGANVVQPCPPPSSLSLYPPTVLCGVAPSCPCVVAPPPGPLLPMLSFRTAGEGLTIGNHSPHGQAASVWTEDLTLALESAKSLSVGTVWVNSHSVFDPSLCLSGVKESGNCTDGGQEGLFQFLRPSLSPPLPRSRPLSVDYVKFGSAASRPPIPGGAETAGPARAPRSYLQLVGGRQCKSDSGSSIAILAPDGSVLAYCPDGGRKDVRNAVEAAIKVQPGWKKRSPVSRSQALYSLAASIDLRKRDMAVSLQAQTGLSLEEAEREVELSISRLCDWAAHSDKVGGGVQSLPQSGSALSLPEPHGVVGVVLPDRWTLLSLVSLLGASLAAGNAVVMVPSEKHPLPALDFIQVLQSSDIPEGVVSIITGGRDQLTQAMANHSVIQAIWYWGSQEGCQYLQYTCCNPLKSLWLHCEEQGGAEGKGEGRDWALSHPSLLEEMWRQATHWKSVWIPTA